MEYDILEAILTIIDCGYIESLIRRRHQTHVDQSHYGHKAWVTFHSKFFKGNMKSIELPRTMYKSIFDTKIISKELRDFKSLVDTLPAHL